MLIDTVWLCGWLDCSSADIAHANAMPIARAIVRRMRSWLWNCTSGSRSAAAMQRKAPAARASAAPVSDDWEVPRKLIPKNKDEGSRRYCKGIKEVEDKPNVSWYS